MKSISHRGKANKRPGFTAGFDSATAMVISLSQFLEGKDFPGVGVMPSSEILGKMANWLPDSLKKKLYSASGSFDGVSPEKLGEVQVAELEKWIVNTVPQRKYPVIAIGATHGALVHLYAALGIPWLPQTFLIPVKKDRSLSKDQPKAVMEWAAKPAAQFLAQNPELALHHMMDPNHDRLHLSTMSYFRVKKLKLGNAYKKLIRQYLMPGGTLLIVNCQMKWPVVRVGGRHVFQLGGAGGSMEPEEYYHGSQRVTEFLQKHKASVKTWDAPDPDEEQAEAEWGYASALTDDIQEFAQLQGYQVQQLTFDDPQAASPFVADLYRHWYQQRNIPSTRLLIECFALHAPYWALKTGSVPFWMLFNDKASADYVEHYLQHTIPYDEIYMMLISHGIHSIGLAPIEQWNHILSYARQHHAYIGTDLDKYPVDFGVYFSYNADLQKKIPTRYPMPDFMPLQQAFSFLKHHQPMYEIDWKLLNNHPDAAFSAGKSGG